MLLSRSSKVHLLPATVRRAVSATFCASLSAGLRSSSGARLALPILRFMPALGSCAQGSVVPCASASRPAPKIFAFSRTGAPQAPLAEPSNCAKPSPAAMARSRPSNARSERPCSDDSFDSTATSLRRSISISMPLIAATVGLAVSVVMPLSCGVSSSSTARALTRSACPAILSRSSASFARAGPWPVPIALSRATSDGASGTIKAVSWLNEAALEFRLNFPVALARSKLPPPSMITPSARPIFKRSSEIVFEV